MRKIAKKLFFPQTLHIFDYRFNYLLHVYLSRRVFRFFKKMIISNNKQRHDDLSFPQSALTFKSEKSIQKQKKKRYNSTSENQIEIQTRQTFVRYP